ncbi:MAG: glycoside hydrolase family 130 protein [Luteolibacter sp.]|jgi:predicted GH43/DUF377 family glycosyl hydrolase
MKPLLLCRHEFTLAPDSSRVIIRPFIPGDPQRIAAIIGRALELTEKEVATALEYVGAEFRHRHFDIAAVLRQHYQKIRPHVYTGKRLSDARRQLLGALFSGEYALESAALFNPSIVPHPDQTDVPEGGMRFVLSLRATGEGHISSIEFRSGVIDPEGGISLDAVTHFVTPPEVITNPAYRKRAFVTKLDEMCRDNGMCKAVFEPLGDWFTLKELRKSIARVRENVGNSAPAMDRMLERIEWLAESNYEILFAESLPMSSRIIFPVSPNESNGIEDARFVRFETEDGDVMYYATYTAYNGRTILPQMIETRDFLHFRVLTLSGGAVQNKGMAMFPRRVNGEFLMLSRQDDENLFLMRSRDPHHWDDPQLLMRPAEMWEAVKIGNCGSPIETPDGWLVLTHGVGPMRRYCIGAALLDLDDPSKVIGRLREPLLEPKGNEREGYVPNVVYSCGALVHGGRLVLPYAMSDQASAIVSVPLDDLLAVLKG